MGEARASTPCLDASGAGARSMVCNMTTIQQRFRILLIILVTGLATACGGSNAGEASAEHAHLDPAEVTTKVEAALVPSELVVGPNRFAVGLFDDQGNLIQDARVHFHYYDLSDPENAVLESEVTAQLIQDSEGYTTIFTHNRDFEIAGQWGVEIDVYLPDGNTAKQRIGFQVESETSSLGPGEKVPILNTLTLDDVDQDLSRLTSSTSPNPALHEISLAQALANGTPTILLFATPAFCQTRFCGPAYEIVGEVYETHGDRLNFVYVEVFDGLPDPSAINFQASLAFTAFGLESEPWLFLIDEDGTIIYRLEGLFTADEVRRQLENRLGLQPVDHP